MPPQKFRGLRTEDIAKCRAFGYAAVQASGYRPGGENDMRVLYVEDDPSSQILVQKRLQPEGIEVIPAESGARAIELLKQHTFDAMILDIMMPGIDGFQVGRFARKEGPNKDIPIILLSAHPLALREPDAQRLRPVASISKPFKADKLIEALRLATAGKPKS